MDRDTRTYIYIYIHTHIHTYVYRDLYIYIYIYTYTCIYVCMYACMHGCIVICICICVCTHTYIYIYVFVYGYVYDLALLLSAATPEDLVEAVKGASSILIDECLKALLHPNLAPGKSEAIFAFVGKNSPRFGPISFAFLSHHSHWTLSSGPLHACGLSPSINI